MRQGLREDGKLQMQNYKQIFVTKYLKDIAPSSVKMKGRKLTLQEKKFSLHAQIPTDTQIPFCNIWLHFKAIILIFFFEDIIILMYGVFLNCQTLLEYSGVFFI